MPSAQTVVATERASRYLAQLCEHLNQIGHNQDGHTPRRHTGMHTGHRPDVRRIEWNDSQGVIEFPFGRCELTADDTGLTILLTAEEPEALRLLRDMVSERIQTIGRRDHLVVTW